VWFLSVKEFSMRRAATYVLAGLLGSTVGLSAANLVSAAPDQRESKAKQAEPKLPDGFQLKDLGQLDNVRDELAKVTEYAFTRGDFGKIIDQLAHENRDRMKDYKNQDFTTLDGVIAQLNKDWNQKYGHDFNIRRANNVFDDRFTIVQGVVTNPQVAAANWPVPPNEQLARSSEERARVASERERGDTQVKDVQAADLQKSSGVALMRFRSFENLPEVTASLINEKGGGWVFDIPTNITAQQLHTQLQNHLTWFGQHVDQWPSDETQAYRMAAHHVLMALYDVNQHHQTRER